MKGYVIKLVIRNLTERNQFPSVVNIHKIMAKEKEKEIALALFVNTDMTQKLIAERLDVSEKTIGSWVEKGAWEKMKLAKQTSMTETVSNLRELLKMKVEENKLKMNDKTFCKADSDQVLDLAKTIEILENEMPLRSYIQVLEEFLQYVPRSEKKDRETIVRWQTEFLTNKAT